VSQNHRSPTIISLLKRTKFELRRWNKERVGNLFTKAEQLEEENKILQIKEMSPIGLTTQELEQLKAIIAQYHTTLRYQKVLWKQKSRIQ